MVLRHTLTGKSTIEGINSPALSYTNWRSGEPNNNGTQITDMFI